MSILWTQQAKDQVAIYLKDGMSGAEIGALVGYTRNAVIGVVHRDKVLRAIGFARRPHEKLLRSPRKKYVRKPKIDTVQEITTEPSPIVQLIEDSEPYGPGKLLWMVERRQCKFEVNNADVGQEHLFCGHGTEYGQNYCLYHHNVATQGRKRGNRFGNIMSFGRQRIAA